MHAHRRSHSQPIDNVDASDGEEIELVQLTERAPAAVPTSSPSSATWITPASILLWYLFSMAISVYNRWMFSPHSEGGLGIQTPILVTCIHQLLLTLISSLTLILIPAFKSANDESMSIKEYLIKVFPCSVASAGDIGLGNCSFRYITLSLYTMVKTSSLIFVLAWGVIFKLEQLTREIVIIVCIMVVGVAMMIGDAGAVVSDATTTFIGVSLVLWSACMSGLRWALTQVLLKRNKRTKNPVLTMFYVSPGMFITLLLVGVSVEGAMSFIRATMWEDYGILVGMALLISPGVLAFCMTMAEYVLLQHASLLTLSVAGVFKELLTIAAGWLVFGDKLSVLNGVGLAVTLVDIVAYNVYRRGDSVADVAADSAAELPVPGPGPGAAGQAGVHQAHRGV